MRSVQHPKVIVLGSSFPEELIHAFGITPYWVLGGSLQTGAWAGELAPRDADPVSRSILGLMLGMLRREGLKVHTLDIPPVKNEPALFKYERQLELCVEAISAHTVKHLTRRSLRSAASLVAQAHDEIRRFLRLTEERPTLLSAPWRMLTCFSYYCADDLPRKR